MEIAIFGGTFDPPTLAHETIIEACLNRQDLDEVWLMPSGVRTDKPGMRPDEVRKQMLEIVMHESFKDNDRLKISNVELDLPRPSITRLTVNTLDKLYPNHRFWYVFGADSYWDIPNWEDGDKLSKTLGMLLVPRAGYELPQECSTIRHLVVETNIHEVSSTVVRVQLQTGSAIDGMVSRGVARYIHDRQPYSAVQ